MVGAQRKARGRWRRGPSQCPSSYRDTGRSLVSIVFRTGPSKSGRIFLTSRLAQLDSKSLHLVLKLGEAGTQDILFSTAGLAALKLLEGVRLT